MNKIFSSRLRPYLIAIAFVMIPVQVFADSGCGCTTPVTSPGTGGTTTVNNGGNTNNANANANPNNNQYTNANSVANPTAQNVNQNINNNYNGYVGWGPGMSCPTTSLSIGAANSILSTPGYPNTNSTTIYGAVNIPFNSRGSLDDCANYGKLMVTRAALDNRMGVISKCIEWASHGANIHAGDLDIMCHNVSFMPPPPQPVPVPVPVPVIPTPAPTVVTVSYNRCLADSNVGGYYLVHGKKLWYGELGQLHAMRHEYLASLHTYHPMMRGQELVGHLARACVKDRTIGEALDG